MATEKALRAAAKEMQDVMGLEPPLNVKAPLADLTEQFKEAIEQIQEGDEFTEATQAIIDEFNAPEDEEEAPAPKRKKAPVAPVTKKKAPVVEEEEEKEEEEEEEEEVVVPKKKGQAATPAATTPKKTPFVAAAVHRAETYSLALAKNPKTLKQWAEMANAIYVKNGGRDSMKQSDFDVQWLVKLFKHLDIEIPTK